MWVRVLVTTAGFPPWVATVEQVDLGLITSAALTARTPSRTPWGETDLQHVWNNTVNTPLERPADLVGQKVLTGKEVTAQEARRDAERAPRAGDTGTYNNFWRDARVLSTRKALITDPSTGSVPELTLVARQREAERAANLHKDLDGVGADGQGGCASWGICVSRRQSWFAEYSQRQPCGRSGGE